MESTPRYFSGPDPWVELNTLPDEFPDAAIASVYSEGFRVAWVVLDMSGPAQAWYETTQYFFDRSGLIRKRERRLEQANANVRIDEAKYFDHGRLIKTEYHHSPLEEGKEDWDVMFDPGAPEYISTAELPVILTGTELRLLTDLVCVLKP